ncbi:hypothetical protein SmJEL517_g05916 [Synchytrium microbalum]|uniref:Dienelactone hydrolase domain-containing protein n=1 Tax=Synchytrium microbalum TaxID=1806994 RepID=A0A507BT39_9FUNG|nr:uncharacterized protein SmJEL517_g05916 [Synchytrium microbalum]TPX30528.1 hypothetical protein SmJEL517_g05916 [Synchytrium microbalum]
MSPSDQTGWAKECSCVPEFQSDYKPVGREILLGKDLKCYVVGDENAKRTIIFCYDVIGYQPRNTRQTVDQLALRGGFKVIMPDFFRGARFVPGGPVPVYQWIQDTCPWPVVEKDLPLVHEYLKKTAESICWVGTCYGGMIGSIVMGRVSYLTAGVFIHPGTMSMKDPKYHRGPVYLMPSRDEPDLLPYYAELQKRPFGAISKHTRFENMPHGWCSARGAGLGQAEKDVPKEQARAVQMIIEWLNGILADQNLVAKI